MACSNSVVIAKLSNSDFTVRLEPAFVNSVVKSSLQDPSLTFQLEKARINHRPGNLSKLRQKVPANFPFGRENSSLLEFMLLQQPAEPGESPGNVVELACLIVRPENATVFFQF